MRMTLGLRPLDLRTWFERGPQHAAVLAHKQHMLATAHDQVVATAPEGLAGSREVLGLVTAWLAEHDPSASLDIDPTQHPIEAASRLVADDLCVLSDMAGAWCLTAASVCAPSRWRLADKIGRSVAEIHEPVPDYSGWYARTVDDRLDRLDAERPIWRTNWTVLDDPALFQPGGSPAAAPADIGLDDLTLRVERQTLRRLPDTGDILFTIRTERARLSQVAADAEAAAALATTLRTCSPELAHYKGWTQMLPRVITLLERAGGVGSIP